MTAWREGITVRALRVILCLLAPLALAGCVPLAVGGAAAGGYYIGKDERPAAVIASDARITSTIKTRLVGDKYVDALDVNVDTYAGVVTLRGEVSNSIAREQAERLATSVEGVEAVKNEIKIVRKSDD